MLDFFEKMRHITESLKRILMKIALCLKLIDIETTCLPLCAIIEMTRDVPQGLTHFLLSELESQGNPSAVPRICSQERQSPVQNSKMNQLSAWPYSTWREIHFLRENLKMFSTISQYAEIIFTISYFDFSCISRNPKISWINVISRIVNSFAFKKRALFR